MAVELRGTDISYLAGEGLASSQYLFVRKDATTGKIMLLDSATDVVLGILQNDPELGEAAQVRIDGVSKLVANAALAINKYVVPEFVSASDAGKGGLVIADHRLIRGKVLLAAGAEDDLATVQLIPDQNRSMNVLGGQTTKSSQLVTAGVETYLAADMIGGFILRDPTGGSRADKFDSAVNIIAAMTQAGIGQSFELIVQNDADAAETITMSANTGLTLTGIMTIAENNSKRFLIAVLSSTTVEVTSMGTFTSST